MSDPDLLNNLLANRVQTNSNNVPHTSVHWSDEKASDFKELLDRDKIQEVTDVLSHMNPDNINQEGLDQAVKAISDIFNTCAKNLGICKEVKSKKVQRKSGAQPWFNNDCENSRKAYLDARNAFSVNKTQLNKNIMKRLNKEYKKSLKRARRSHQIDLNNKLRNLKCSDPKGYWKIIKGRHKQEELPIENNTMYQHFKNLSQTAIDLEAERNVFEQGCEEYNLEINAPFSIDEIKKCIKKLKNNKAYGTDMILNEYLKYTDDTLLPVYVKLLNIVLDTGIVPNTWLIGIIKPLYKNKGDKEDPNPSIKDVLW